MTTGNLDVMSVVYTVQQNKKKHSIYEISDCIPKESNPLDFMEIMKMAELRDAAIKEGMYAFVSWKWVNPLAEWIGKRKCLEVMAGRGILSYALRQKGINIITTDDYSWFGERYTGWQDTITEVIKLDAIEAVKQYGKDVDILIMSWPYMDDTAFNVIKELYQINPEAVVVYIGEGHGGCTADDNFHEHFQEIEDELFEGVVSNFEQWPNIHDEPQLGRYIEEKTY